MSGSSSGLCVPVIPLCTSPGGSEIVGDPGAAAGAAVAIAGGGGGAAAAAAAAAATLPL